MAVEINQNSHYIPFRTLKDYEGYFYKTSEDIKNSILEKKGP